MKFDFKHFLLFLSLLYLTLYIPLSFMIYSNSWYEFNYQMQNTYDILGKKISNNVTTNLINFFMYKEKLNDNWNSKEIIHMRDVRKIYTILFILGILSFFGINYFFDKKKVLKYLKSNIFIVLSLFLILPFFVYFWDNIFHLILFNNNAWINNSNDISYYLFSYNFFRNSLIFLIFGTIFINLGFLFLLKKYSLNLISIQTI